jgi:uncharacterized protein (TIGR00251 family)
MPGIADALFDDRFGTVISVEVTAGSKADVFPDGYNEWRKAIGCRVSAPAEKGRANRAVVTLIADLMGVPVSSVLIQSGSTTPQKKIRIAGLSKTCVLGRLLQKT